ncbi:MAG: trehalase family glycosidase [Prolixibacteraceae bacterium]
MKKFLFILILGTLLYDSAHSQNTDSPESKYKAIQNRLKTGWGTFNHKSVLSHVLLPDGLALNIGIKLHQNNADNYLKEAFISSRGNRPEKITPGYKAYDGSYSELTIEWNGVKFSLESATTKNQDLILLVTPIQTTGDFPSVVLEVGMLWNRTGTIEMSGSEINVRIKGRSGAVRSIGVPITEYIANTSPYLAVRLDRPVAFYTGEAKSLKQLKEIVQIRRNEQESIYKKYGVLAPTYQALQSVIGWNVIYDASNDRVIFPVSRLWNDNFGGQYVLFDWDTYFGAWMASLESKELAYANAVEITKHITPGGFIPNFAGSYGSASFDRSQPPVGSLVFKEFYLKYRDKWLLEYVFDDLVTWNRWWPKNRDSNGLLCWGSSTVEPPLKSDFATNEWQGAAYESGLDNSPMFDKIPFNKQTHMLELADAGLTGLYVMDCDALTDIATILGKADIVNEMKKRGEQYRKNLGQLWDDKAGIYKNKRTDTGEFSARLSPTNFYPLLAKAATQAQAERMVKEHLFNPEEFNGEWMMPSIAANDLAFKDQNYWRGRIWGPMNFLVYLGLKNYNLPEARKILAEKSNRLMMENVKLNGYIYENYNAITGNVKDPAEGKRMGDNYYHWGALLGFIALQEAEKGQTK